MFRYLTLAAVVLLSPYSPAEAAENPRSRLSILIGDWTIEGREDSFREVCEWFDDRSHVVCNSEMKTKKGIRRGVSIFSFSDNDARFKYYHYNSAGLVVAQDAFFSDGGLMTTSESRVASDLIREQVWVTPRSDGSFDFREEVSKNAGPWEVTTRLRYLLRNNTAEKAN